MASFVEQATLKVNDQSSAQIRKINAELKKLEQTARSLKNIKVNITINEKGIQSALQKMKALQSAARQAGSARINLNVNASGLTRAQQQIQRLRQQASRPINVNTRNTGGGGGGGGGAGRRGLRQTGIQHQMGNFSMLRGAASVVIGGTAYAVAAKVAKTAVDGVIGSEDARTRLRQSGFDKGRTDQLTPQTDYIMAMARKAQEEFNRIPAAEIANASVEQLNALKAAGKSSEDMQAAMYRIARNAQIMGMTFKDPKEGAEGSRQLERVSQIMGQDIDDAKIRQIQDSAMRAIIATGGEIKAEEAVRALQQLGSTLTLGLSPKGLSNLLLVRDEGGRQSTAEFRTAIQNLSTSTINKSDKAAQVALGLRKKGGTPDSALVAEASSDLVGFTKNRIMPLLAKAGVDQTSAPAVGTWLDEHGFSTSGARAFAAIVTKLSSGEFQRQQKAVEYADLDPHLGDRTFRGGTERMSASFQTAMARTFDKSGGAFVDAIQPFSVAMDKSGKAAELGNYGQAALEMTKGVAQMMGGPAGALLTAKTALDAAITMADPTASKTDKAAAMLVTGSTALLTAAGAMMNYFGGGDPNKDLEHLKTLKDQGPEELSVLRKRLADEQAKPKTGEPGVRQNQSIITGLAARIDAAERQARTIDGDIAVAQAKVDALKKEQADTKTQEAARMEQMRRDAGLDPVTAQPTAPAAAGPIPAATVAALQQLNTSGGLAGVKSITALLAALNQPTSVKSREELATSLGYTGKLGGSAEMNTFLLNFLKKLAAEPPVVPPVTPPVEVKPTEEPKPVVVEPPKAPVPIEQPVVVTPIEPTKPVVPPPVPWQPGDLPPGARPPSFLPGLLPQGLKPVTELIDFDPAKVQFASMFTTGASTIGDSGKTVGSNAASTLSGEAGGIGGAIGRAAAAIISAATVNVSIPNQGSSSGKASTGPLTA